MSSAQWAEVAGAYCEEPSGWALVSALLTHFGVTVEPVLAVDGARAGLMRRTHPGLSLGDRLCLATAERLQAEVLTADKAWGFEAPIRQIR
jgi:PIN domain nuclease of toxin-antitoxin system